MTSKLNCLVLSMFSASQDSDPPDTGGYIDRLHFHTSLRNAAMAQLHNPTRRRLHPEPASTPILAIFLDAKNQSLWFYHSGHK